MLENAYVWYGHSVLLLKLGNKNILIDPMFGPDASPIGPIRTKRFSKNSLQIIDQLPPIDAVFMSHDHYDHLDLASFEKLIPKVGRFFVRLGVGRHLKAWSVDHNKIQELDWWQNIQLDDILIEFVPSRHFTGRGINDRQKSLWGGYVFKTKKHSLYFSGDGGYGPHFEEIGKKHGPFDLAFIECGQYNEEWHQIHMYPEESVQAALAVQTKIATPIHWAGFKLSVHPWKDPIERFEIKALELGLAISTAMIGEIVNLSEELPVKKWWENYD